MRDLDFRLMVPDDLAFIMSTFLRGYRNSPFTRLVSSPTYFDTHVPLFESILGDPNTTVALAVNPENANHIYAWCVVEKLGPVQVLHYVYTKETYRNFGIALSLLEVAQFKIDEPFFYTFTGRDFNKLRLKYESAVYNPFLAYKPKER